MGYRAFTLLELLTVISVFTVLASLLMPVIAGARKTSRMVQCESNQRQLYAIWTTKLNEAYKGRIPRTYNTSSIEDSWFDLLEEDYVRLRSHEIATPMSPAVCPVVEDRYDRPSYNSIYTGYAINCRWKEGGPPGSNELKMFDALVSPSSYPLFSEAAIMPGGDIARSYIGSGPTAFGRWGLAMPHMDGVGVVVYGDGHSDEVTDSDLEFTDSGGLPVWFFD